jgi:hypothetical protein
MKRDLKEILAKLTRAGWEARVTGSGHWRLRAPSGALIFTASTPSDYRGLANLRARLRRAGAPV